MDKQKQVGQIIITDTEIAIYDTVDELTKPAVLLTQTENRYTYKIDPAWLKPQDYTNYAIVNGKVFADYFIKLLTWHLSTKLQMPPKTIENIMLKKIPHCLEKVLQEEKTVSVIEARLNTLRTRLTGIGLSD